ncbi:uncharacterized [Tachysurus ichikawai]
MHAGTGQCGLRVQAVAAEDVDGSHELAQLQGVASHCHRVHLSRSRLSLQGSALSPPSDDTQTSHSTPSLASSLHTTSTFIPGFCAKRHRGCQSSPLTNTAPCRSQHYISSPQPEPEPWKDERAGRLLSVYVRPRKTGLEWTSKAGKRACFRGERPGRLQTQPQKAYLTSVWQSPRA